MLNNDSTRMQQPSSECGKFYRTDGFVQQINEVGLDLIIPFVNDESYMKG